MGVRTPWGDSEELRERRLTPGPGNDREEVERNQRERLFGAMVASVAERGYEATTMGHLAELSGVSSRTAYDLFGDKEAVFVATLEAMIEAVVGVAAGPVADPESGDWEARARAASHALAALVVAQPAASKMFLVDVFAAGPAALAALERLLAGFEVLAREMAAQSPERAGTPPEMTAAFTGAIEEIARMRLVAGEEAELPGLIDQIWDLIGSYRPPPWPLHLNGRVPKVTGESLEAHDQAERVIRAFAVAVAEKGYGEATVGDAVRIGKMSTSTFYVHFQGKEEAMLAAIDSAGAQMGAAMVPAIRRAPEWPQAVRAALGALFNFLASRPALARLMLVEVYAAGPEALRRRVEYLAPLERLIGEGAEQSEAPGITVELLAGVVYSLARRRVREQGPRALPKLAPLCAYLTLMPYIGAEEAAQVANEEEGRRG
jgi:AcrR family transcriptional regulator